MSTRQQPQRAATSAGPASNDSSSRQSSDDTGVWSASGSGIPPSGREEGGNEAPRSVWFETVWPRCAVTAGLLALAVALVWAARSPGPHERASVLASAGQRSAEQDVSAEAEDEFDDAKTLALLDRIRAAAVVCTERLSPRKVTVRVTFYPSGEAGNVDIDERARIDDATADCLDTVFGLARVHPFRGPPRTVAGTWQMP